MHPDKQSIFWPTLVITLFGSIAFSISLWLLYQAAYQRQLQDLASSASSLAYVMEAVAQFDRQHNPGSGPDDARRASISQLEQGLNFAVMRADSVEMVFGYREGRVIQTVRKTAKGIEYNKPVADDGKLAQALHLALAGKHGYGELLDYRGKAVLAGYAPVPSLNIGIVYKIPLTQVRAPFIRAASWAGGILLLMIVLFVGGFIWFNRRLSNQLLASEQQFAAIVEHLPLMVFMKRAQDLRFVLFNRAGEELIGVKREQLIGKTDYDLFPKQQADFFTARDRQVLDKSDYADIAEEIIDTQINGRRILHTQKIALKDAQGKSVYLLGISEDITDRIASIDALQRNEHVLKDLNASLESRVNERTNELQQQIQRNDLILDVIFDGFIATDQTGRVQYANPAFCALLGYTLAEVAQMHISDFAASESPQEITARIEKINCMGHDRFDTRHRHKNGRIIDVEVSVNLVEIGSEKLFYAFIRDITPRKQTEALLIAARDEAQHASQAKSEFLSRMSHELRTPMNAILGFTQVLQRENLTPSQLKYSQEIQDAGGYLLDLINELLDMSRIESGTLAMVIQAVDVRSVVAEAIRMVQPLVKQHHITMLNECRNDHVMLADRSRLRQILLNLLTNSTKYNRDEGYIHIECQLKTDKFLRLVVTDTGIGIAADKLDKLFQPFERLGADKAGIDGTGIGLAICKKLTELMGGKIGVDTAQGEGSTFWIELPMAINSQADTHNAAGSTGKNTDKKVVLYIEDNVANLKLVEAIFQHQPELRLISATNGKYGIELAQQYQPDLILLDIHLPDINGYEVLAALRSDNATWNIPVIAVSADAMPLDIEKGKQAGFDNYITKPIKIENLMAAVENSLEA